MSENTARMRVERALEKLRALLAKRGITTGTALASVISANAVQTAPTTFAQTFATASLAGVGASSLSKILNKTPLKIAAGALVAGGIIALKINQSIGDDSQLRTEPASQTIGKSNIPPKDQPLASANNSELPDTNSTIQPLKISDESGESAAQKIATTSQEQLAKNSASTNRTVINLKIKVVSLSEEGLQALRPAWPSPNSGSGKLSSDQFDFVNKALKNAGFVSASSSQITAFSGQNAVVFLKTQNSADDTNTTQSTMFGVTPSYSPDTAAFQLDILVKLFAADAGAFTIDSMALEKTNSTTITLSANQTAVLQKEIVPESSASGSSNPRDTKTLLVFVTPEIADPNQAPHLPQLATTYSIDASTLVIKQSPRSNVGSYNHEMRTGRSNSQPGPSVVASPGN
jgi:hypothetical protein